MSLRDGWGWHPPQTASHIHIIHGTTCLRYWYWHAVSRVYRCTLIPFHWPSWPQIQILELWVTYGVEIMQLHHGWDWYPPQTASHIHIRHIHSVWAIGMLSQGHMGAPSYHTQAKLAWDFGISVSCGVEMMPFHHGWGWYSPQIDHIHIIHVQCVWGIDIGMLSQGHIGAPSYHSTGQVGPRFWSFGSLMEWNWCNYIMVEADTYLRLLPTSILGIYKVFEILVCCLKGIWVHPYTVTQAKLAWDFRFFV